MTLGIHGAVPLCVLLGSMLIAHFWKQEDLTEGRVIVEAKLVRLGQKFDPRKLPKKTAMGVADPRRPHASSDGIFARDAGVTHEKPFDDLKALGARAGQVASTHEEVVEGDPDGVAEGTASEGTEGDLYAGKLIAFLREGWVIPSLIPQDELKKLTANVDIHINAELIVDAFAIKRTSDNDLFDQSVVNRLEDLKTSKAKIPEPPPEVAKDFINRTITVRFNGRDL